MIPAAVLFLLVAALAQAQPAPRASTAPARASALAPRGASAPTVGTWRAVQFNRRELPTVERLPATTGWHHYVKLEQAVVTLRADGKFVASFRYWHHHLADGARVPDAPVMSETHRGTWTVNGGTVTFVPQVPRGRRRPDPITGTIAGNRLQVRYLVRDGRTTRPLRLDMERDAGW